MKNKLFIDDVRKPPDKTWHVSRTNTEAIAALRSPVKWDIISIDHDIVFLPDPNITLAETFMPVIWYLQVSRGHIDHSNAIIICHSFNDVARPRMVQKLSEYKNVIDARIGSKEYYRAIEE